MMVQSGYLERPAPSGLADVIDIILDKGIVIDAYVRVSLLGIELLTLDARVVIASVDTYLRFAEATNRLDLDETRKSLAELVVEEAEEVTTQVAEAVVEKKVEDVKEKVEEKVEDVEEKVEDVKEKVGGAVETVVDTVADTARSLLPWTPESARTLVDRLSPFATRVLRYVAERAPSVPVAEVLEHFDLADEEELDRRMSSLRAAMDERPGAADPMSAVDDEYRMDTEDARMFLDALRARRRARRRRS